ncbi:MAG: DUF3034 family protein [Bryobacteraceae bacterium]|jgi:hypothetical protein
MDNVSTSFHSLVGRVSGAAALLLAGFLGAGAAAAQSLNWDGQTGVFITPLAYTAASPASGFGHPIVAYHFLDAGSVLGNFHTISVTEGVGGRVEFGYTRDLHQEGSTAGLSPLWGSGFNLVHAKVNVVKENAGKQAWLPAISGGFVARTQDRDVSGLLATPNKNYSNADFYLVASKTITQTKVAPIVLNLGYKETNASVYGLAGNAPGYTGRLFGAAAFVIKGPAKSSLILGSEFSQEPRQVQNLPGADVPTTITYAARIVPLEKQKFNVDFGVAQAAGTIEPGVNLKARHQFALGVSYGL